MIFQKNLLELKFKSNHLIITKTLKRVVINILAINLEQHIVLGVKIIQKILDQKK